MNLEIKNKLNNILDNLISISSGIKEGVVKNKELHYNFSTSIKDIYALLEQDSFEYRKFDNWKISNYQTIWMSTRTAEHYATGDKAIQDLISILKQLTGYNYIDDEKHFKVGDNYEINRYLIKIFENSENEILIVDSYADANLFDFIEQIRVDIDIKIITSTGCKKMFKELSHHYKENNLNVKLTETIHDRYIVLDKKIIYLIGTSFNHMGNKDFSIKQLSDMNKIHDLYNSWNSAKLLT